MDFDGFKDEMWEIALSLKTGMDEIIEPFFESEGLSKTQAIILLGIKTNCATATVGSMAEHLSFSQGNFSSVCKKMEKMGLVQRRRNKDDERIVALALTELGEEKIALIHEKIFGVFRSAEISGEQFAEIATGFKSLQKLIKRVKEQTKNLKNN